MQSAIFVIKTSVIYLLSSVISVDDDFIQLLHLIELKALIAAMTLYEAGGKSKVI